MKSITQYTKKKIRTGYSRWKKQVIALNLGNIPLVKRLADEARTELANKYKNNLSLPF